jgi:hypothetical protein
MAGITDRGYSTVCGALASALGISLAAARRKVDIRAAQDGRRDLEGRMAVAETMLADLRANPRDHQGLLTAQLGTVGNDDQFMVED